MANDRHGKHNKPTIAFRVTPYEQHVCVVGKRENLEILRSEAREMYTVLEEVSKDIKKDSPDLSEQGMESMTERFLAFLDAMMWMLKGSKYLWEEKDNERNSK